MSGETTNARRPAANTALASMRAPQACSFFPLTSNDTSHSRASSMHLTQWRDQTSAVGSLLGELAGQSIQKDAKIGRLLALEKAVGRASELIDLVNSIRNQSAVAHMKIKRIDGRQSIA